VAQLASVLGRDFGYQLLRAVSDLSDAELDTQLAVLMRAEILLQRGLPPRSDYTFKHALIQEAAYETLLKSSRRQHHRRVAETYLARFADEARTHPAVVAHHFGRAGMLPEAILHWQKAGELAESRSGYAEAIGHFNAALDLLELLPQSAERDRTELSVRVKLGAPLQATKGLGSDEAGRSYARACVISEKAGDSPERFMALWGDWYYQFATHLERSATRANEMVALSERLGDPDLVLQALHSRWGSFQYRGSAAVTRADTQQGIRLYDRQRHHHHTHIYGGHDPGVCALGHGAISAWLTGHADEAGQLAEDTLLLSRDLGHPFSHAIGMYLASQAFAFRGDGPRCRTIADEMLELSRRHAFEQMLPVASAFSGWACVDLGETSSGLNCWIRGWSDTAASLCAAGCRACSACARTRTFARATRFVVWSCWARRLKCASRRRRPTSAPRCCAYRQMPRWRSAGWTLLPRAPSSKRRRRSRASNRR
jgi:predicted ATPase